MNGLRNNFLIKLFKDSSIKSKLLLSYLVLIVIPLGLITWLTYNKSSKITEDNMMKITSLALDQISNSLETKLSDISKVSEAVINNYDIQEILVRDLQEPDIMKQVLDARKMELFLKSFQNSRDVYRVRLFVNDGLIYANENTNFFNMKQITREPWYEQITSNSGSIHWTPSYLLKYDAIEESKSVISAVRVINNYKAFGEYIGVVCVDTLEEKIVDILQKSTLTKNGVIYIIDENGEVVSSSNRELTKAMITGGEKSYYFPSQDAKWEKIKIDGQTMLTSYRKVKLSGWKLVAVIPLEDILTSNIILRNYSLALLVAIGFIAYGLALSISFYIVKRINRLIKTMRVAQEGNLKVRVKIDGKDEIGELEKNFNQMIEGMTLMVEEKYKMGKELKNAELKALQAQINPHFLYNTLDLINWRANRYKAQDIKFIVSTLARFYKLSLSKGREIVSIADELAHVEAYVQIQNKRFKDKIHFTIDVDEKIRSFGIIKLILQPIVENAILHGINEKEDPSGNITIKGNLGEESILLIIMDDGVGMSEEMLRTILDRKIKKETGGYGVKNVDERIKIFYGEQYGLSYKSMPGMGTIVEIRIPAIKNAEE